MAPKNPDFEKQLERLRVVVQELEEGDLPLEKGVALYKEGLTLAAACRERLAQARHEIEIVHQGAVQAFEPEADDNEHGEEA